VGKILTSLNPAQLYDLVQNWCDVVVVGSGFYGLTSAEVIARDFNLKVLVLEKRDHIGGNAYSYMDEETGIEIHKYGSHLFHTSNKQVFDYISRFTALNSYRHKVLTVWKNRVFPMPINLLTINNFFGKNFSPAEAKLFFENLTSSYNAKNSESLEDKCIATIGIELYESLIKGYTLKQWQQDPKYLPAEIITRLPIRFNYSDGYFQDIYEGLPMEGYLSLFQKMANHQNIVIALNVDYFMHRDLMSNKKMIFTGPIDRYFNYSEGDLDWRTLDLELEKLNVDDFQGTAVMNFAEASIPYTRVHEFKHLHPERNHMGRGTILMREYSRKASAEDDPYYPVNSAIDRKILSKYRERMRSTLNVHFGGRLGTYQYLDMHMAIASALTWTNNHFLSWYQKRNTF
jgi:UDP-galactopyranose mutase